MTTNLNAIRLCTKIFFWIYILALPIHAHSNQFVHSVRVEPVEINTSKDEIVQISWELSESGMLDVFICDIDGNIVKTLLKQTKSSQGQQVTWDGKDDFGNRCPTGAYLPIIKIRTSRKGSEVYNPTTSPWGYEIQLANLVYDENQQVIRYTLEKPVLCLMRLGEKDGGPCYRTLFGWEPRSAGTHEEAWDGKDANGIINVAQKEKFKMFLDAFVLPENSIMIRGSNEIPAVKYKTFALRAPHGNKVMLHALHSRELDRELSIRAEIVNPVVIKNKIPTVKGKASIRVHVDEKTNVPHLLREKFEVYLFIDGVLLYEIPAEEIPAIATFDTRKYADKEYALTINIRTPDDRVGTYSMKIRIKK